MDKSSALGTENLYKLIARFAIPSVIGMMITALYNVVDRIFVGNIPNIGDIAFAGVSLTYPLTLIMIASAGLFKLGSSSFASISLGEGNREKANKTVNLCFVMCFILGLIFTVIILGFTDPILRMLGASDATLPHARDYIRVIAYGSVFNFVGFGMNNILYVDGSPKVAMGSMIIGGVLNMVLDPIFIFVFNQGAKGAAIATVISQIVSCIWTMGYFFTKRCSFEICLNDMKPDFALLYRVVLLGMPVFINQMAHSSYVTVLNKQAGRFGADMAITSISIVLIISQFTMLPVIGISHGLQPIWGYNFGSKNYNRVIKSFYIGVVSGTIYILGLFFIYMIFPEFCGRLFVGSSPVDMVFTAKAIRIFLLLEPLTALDIMAANFYPSIKMPLKSLILNVFKQVIVLIPLLYILPIFMNLDGVLYAGPIAQIITTILTISVLAKDINGLKNSVENTAATKA